MIKQVTQKHVQQAFQQRKDTGKKLVVLVADVQVQDVVVIAVGHIHQAEVVCIQHLIKAQPIPKLMRN